MADWLKPTITSNYVTFVDEVKNRDIDAITLQKDALVNPPTGSIKLLRSPAKFQEWNGTAFVDVILSVAGGGTGSSTPGGAASALGLGSMAFQNSNAVSITGGNIANLSGAGRFDIAGLVAITAQSVGGGYGIYVQGFTGQYPGVFIGSPTAPSYGVLIQAGITRSEVALAVTNYASNRQGIIVNGFMEVSLPWRLIIPVGADYWVTT
jgi:hypothetical protein